MLRAVERLVTSLEFKTRRGSLSLRTPPGKIWSSVEDEKKRSGGVKSIGLMNKKKPNKNLILIHDVCFGRGRRLKPAAAHSCVLPPRPPSPARRINIGSRYQAEVPELRQRTDVELDPHRADLVWAPLTALEEKPDFKQKGWRSGCSFNNFNNFFKHPMAPSGVKKKMLTFSKIRQYFVSENVTQGADATLAPPRA